MISRQTTPPRMTMISSERQSRQHQCHCGSGERRWVDSVEFTAGSSVVADGCRHREPVRPISLVYSPIGSENHSVLEFDGHTVVSNVDGLAIELSKTSFLSVAILTWRFQGCVSGCLAVAGQRGPINVVWGAALSLLCLRFTHLTSPFLRAFISTLIPFMLRVWCGDDALR